MEELWDSNFFSFLGIIVQSVSIGFGVGWGIKKIFEMLMAKFDNLENNQEKIIDNQESIISILDKKEGE